MMEALGISLFFVNGIHFFDKLRNKKMDLPKKTIIINFVLGILLIAGFDNFLMYGFLWCAFNAIRYSLKVQLDDVEDNKLKREKK